MKILIIKGFAALFACSLLCGTALAAETVKGYVKKDGTVVNGYVRSTADNYRYNNYGSQSNGGKQRDEFSEGYGATNQKNDTYKYRDNDNDGQLNGFDQKPETQGY